MGQQLLHFIAKHWYWVAAFIIAVVWLFYEESKSRGMGGSRLDPAGVTRLINSEKAKLLDIRETAAFAEGHIVGSINIPFAELERSMQRLEKYKQRPIIVVCPAGQKAVSVMQRLRKQGFPKVFVLAGGINAWKRANMPLVKKR